MKIIYTVADLKASLTCWRSKGLSVSLVPTMGGVHEGHLSLIRLGHSKCDRVVATLFVNPSQFSSEEDFDEYPCNEEADLKLFNSAGADLVFVPTANEMYPANYSTRVVVEGLGDILEGEFRPHFFSGVATIVSKILNQSLPDVAVFGEKDYQQLCVIRTMVRDLNIPVKVVGGETIREADGLAMSSRNLYLNNHQRAIAPALYQVLQKVAKSASDGDDLESICRDGVESLVTAGFDKVDYLAVCDDENLAPLKELHRSARVLTAAWLGRTRLIDNISIVP